MATATPWRAAPLLFNVDTAHTDAHANARTCTCAQAHRHAFA